LIKDWHWLLGFFIPTVCFLRIFIPKKIKLFPHPIVSRGETTNNLECNDAIRAAALVTTKKINE